ncbi:MAG: DegT/DnrJ/EryC1/StrS aminotransferase [Candidatus Zambryskibacteria bacterium RIFCSPLOWO2_02_FULL_39_26]|uniref:DegT/DnrJ/EryC1/StrS aminotransferase n=2 Tax=Candidatus Zambryskiibacteriota TaxID=1817925 RepID=A0A1G2USV8_9BACT|nr:MAG: DegT/DnrJ/EryC1/StrS aminotransferase [Candidatus Zambryskibacteria bacterium RIFCSPHIGHO2_12_FULL_39_47]OHB10542.1 MAG: DegT/DnrJ/EryC1/StrS aminotransferase [Candidatus Zambryskibacteria bacterium RIFCSPLOWO2_02_FULL_39_26]OHB12464.1 MAG: DegT/DnrJ/EryC1/StrS aminotransferase [Candidatus Zambryskibacteria bacterium RIFCSPLOWO2_12_39_8]OHB13068.1 MAG: DegT/DnrJ/EryC1/StrS aminotransferase [Candidatus Zambryskibacteria bacterium RIFCSPLOWO2_12_FULL_39_23]
MIKLIKSTFYNEKLTKKQLCDFILKTEQLSIGKHCAQFEKDFSKWQGRKFGLMFNSGSSANLALIQVLINLKKIKAGDCVGFSAVTWATNVMPLITMNLKPVPIDIELETLNISSKKVEESYKKHKFQCLFITNLLGYCSDLDKIRNFCNNNKILLIEDNCESLGSVYKGTKLGNFSFASTFSFYVGHHLSTIEGGMVCTNDREIDTMLRIVRSHGWDRHLTPFEQKKFRKKYKVDEFYGKYTFYDIGYNFRPTEIQGFLGSNQLKYLNTMVNKRESNYKQFEKIYSNPDFVKMNTKGLTKISNFALPLICKDKSTRDKYIKKAEKVGIETRPIVAGNINNQAFFSKYVNKKFSLKNAERIHHTGFYFGNNPDMTEKEVRFLVKTFQ